MLRATPRSGMAQTTPQPSSHDPSDKDVSGLENTGKGSRHTQSIKNRPTKRVRRSAAHEIAEAISSVRTSMSMPQSTVQAAMDEALKSGYLTDDGIGMLAVAFSQNRSYGGLFLSFSKADDPKHLLRWLKGVLCVNALERVVFTPKYFTVMGLDQESD